MEAMRIIPADERHFEDLDWLQTYWLFSFDRYFDPNNVDFGNLRVFNDDRVAPRTGFPPHPHANMEIVTIVLEGEITHEDSIGTTAVIKMDEVQHMTAGAGVTHSEFNRGVNPLHLYQIWLTPKRLNAKPAYTQKAFHQTERKNTLQAVASGQNHAHAIPMDADATIYLSDLERNASLEFTLAKSRGVFIYITRGSLEVNGKKLEAGDQARIEKAGKIMLGASNAASFVLIDVSLA